VGTMRELGLIDEDGEVVVLLVLLGGVIALFLALRLDFLRTDTVDGI